MSQVERICTAQSTAPDAMAAVAEFHAQVRQDRAALVIFFCSSSYDLDMLATEMTRLFADVPVVGCTTAGEIGPSGYCSHSLSGMSFPAGACSAVAGRLGQLHEFETKSGGPFVQDLLRKLEAQDAGAGGRNTFGLLLIDGLSEREEPVAHALQEGLGGIEMIGGSAGDDLKFEQTWVFHDGAFHANSAVLALVSTRFPFRALQSQHFVPASERLVVTAVDAARRVVKEINGLPAVTEYARMIGVPADRLEPAHFAAWPIVVMIGGDHYVRSIQRANVDGSLTLYCAIDVGVVMRLARGEDMSGKLAAAFADLRKELGELQAVIVCDCVLRDREATGADQNAAISDTFRRNRAVGFSTYGEQFHGLHLNQTMTAIAIGGGTENDD